MMQLRVESPAVTSKSHPIVDEMCQCGVLRTSHEKFGCEDFQWAGWVENSRRAA